MTSFPGARTALEEEIEEFMNVKEMEGVVWCYLMDTPSEGVHLGYNVPIVISKTQQLERHGLWPAKTEMR